MNRIDNSGKGIAGLGRGEDTMLAHVAPGEMVVPPVISPQTQEIIKREMMAVGLDPNEYTVGDGMSINPITGMAEFGWLKKTFKSIGKVVKKVAPVAAFIPGVGTALGGVLGGLGGGVVSGLSKIPGLGGVASGIGGLASSAASGLAGLGIPGISSIAGGTAGGFGGIMGGLTNPLAGGMFGKTGSTYAGGPAAGKGLANRFGFGSGTPGQITASGQAQQAQQALQAMTPAQIAANPQLYQQLLAQANASSGSPFGNFFGGQSGGGGLGGMLPLMGLAGLYGQAVKESYKDREGGMRDIRQSIRPDLMPAPTFTGFDLGIRKQAATGGPMEITQVVSRPAEDLRAGLMSGPPMKEALEDRKEYLTFILNSKNEDNIKKEGGRMAVLQELNSISKELAGGFVGLNNAQIRQNKANESMRSVLKGLREPKATGGVAELDMRGGGPSIGPGTGTSDDIPAMLSDGEFVMTSAANNGLGGFKVTKTETGIELIPNGKPDRQKGAQNMDKLMKTFEQFNKIGQA